MPLRQSLRHLLPLLLMAQFIAIATRPELTPLLRWQRAAILHGEWFRLISAHFVHANLGHAVANALALLVLWSLFQRALPLWQWLLAIPLCALLISALLFTTGIDWYVGFSGVLHGLLVLALCRDGRLSWPLRALLLAAVAMKIGAEQVFGADSGEWLNIDVVSEAHLFGALSGAAIAALLLAVSGRSATARRS